MSAHAPLVALVRPRGPRGELPYHRALERHLAGAGAAATTIYADVRYVVTGPSVAGRPAPTRTLPRSLRFLAHLAAARPAAVLCFEYGPETFLSVLVARSTGRPCLVFQEHGGRAGDALSPLDRRYRRLVARLADGVVANSRAAAQELAGLGVPPARIHRITLLAPPAPAALETRRLELPEPHRRPLFVYVGRLIATKNVVTLLEATRRLIDGGRSAGVWIVGAGPEEERLRRRAEELRLGDVVEWLGELPHDGIGHVYARADAMVMPTFGDYRNLSVLEAMRFGKPVIDSTADGNAGDAVVHGETGFLFDPADASALAGLMARLVDDRELRARLGRRARLAVGDQRPDVAAAELVELVRRLTAARSGVRRRRLPSFRAKAPRASAPSRRRAP